MQEKERRQAGAGSPPFQEEFFQRLEPLLDSRLRGNDDYENEERVVCYRAKDIARFLPRRPRGGVCAARESGLAAGSSKVRRRVGDFSHSLRGMLFPSRFSMSRSASRSSGVAKVMASPSAWARPVRPMRWM